MDVLMQLKRGMSRQWSLESLKNKELKMGKVKSMKTEQRFSFGRQSSMDPHRRSQEEEAQAQLVLAVPEQLDATMQMLFLTCKGDVKGVQALLDSGHVHVDSADFDDRRALHVASCEGHVDVVKLLISRGANVNVRDRWGSTPIADAKFYGNEEICSILKAKGAKIPKTPMCVSNPRNVPEYELHPKELAFPKNVDLNKIMHTDGYQLAKWNGTKVAVKILNEDYFFNPESIKLFRNELSLLIKVRHPNVVQFVGAVTQNVPMMIVSEYLSLGNLSSYLQKKGRLKPAKALSFALDIARGMNYLHECKPDAIIHCDLNPNNILRDHVGHLKVTGFGLSRLFKLSSDKVQESHSSSVNELSKFYMAPELYKNEAFDRTVDVFSFGLILYEMIEGNPPFHPKPPEEVSRMMALEDKRPPFKFKNKHYPPDLQDLIQECWDKNPIVRPTFITIIFRLEKMRPLCAKQSFWREAFRFPRRRNSWAFSTHSSREEELTRAQVTCIPVSMKFYEIKCMHWE